MSATLLESSVTSASPSKPRATRQQWAGRVLTGITLLFLVFDTSIKLMAAPEAIAGTTELGFAADQLLTIGLIEAACLILYGIPRTAPLGAVLLTGYLGGAIATHLRLGNPLFSHTLFPTYVGALVWASLYLRDARVRALVQGKP